MNKPIHGNKVNKILLKPRFKIESDQTIAEILSKFEKNIAKDTCKYCSKISGNHIFLDIPKEENHFWSPQLQVEITKDKTNKTIIKGILGPKPQIWTLFMFFYFVITVLFIVFFVWFYVNWSLEKNSDFQLTMLGVLPVTAVVLYFLGQSGKKLGYKQMVELDDFLMKIIKEKNN